MKKQLLAVGLLLLSGLIFNVLARSFLPKREFRGVWVATVVNLDWPSSRSASSAYQIAELIHLIDRLDQVGINAILFQIRPECDALYHSSIEPWSYWLTGKQGQEPNPYYDPLEIAIREAHKRGMELHAWFNPYRVERAVGSYPIDPSHVSRTHPDWVIQIGNLKFLDPGLPRVREYVTRVIMDVVRRYDIDGVHFDDYFYPYPPNQISNQDDQTFANYSRGFSDRGEWRRDNVNLLIAMVYDSIRAVKPYVKFGVSPFGIWKSGVPPGIYGLDAYNTIYCDAVAWLSRRIVDYLTPQLYWSFGGGQDYGTLMPWWASKRNGRHLYPGQAPYRINASNWPADELPRQIRLNRSQLSDPGSVFFRAYHVLSNPKGFTDSLQSNYYRAPALSPVMAWKETLPPETPLNLRYDILTADGSSGFLWDPPGTATDGDTAFRYVLYRFDHASVSPEDLAHGENIVDVTGLPHSIPANPSGTGPFYYAVSALDRNSNESGISNVIQVSPPAIPVLASPADGATNVAKTDTLRWMALAHASGYNIQVSTDSLFQSGFIVNRFNQSDTFMVISGLSGQQTYFWRVNAVNAGGTSEYSRMRAFTTGFPAIPVLAFPANNAVGITVQPTLVWYETPGGQVYQVQVAFSPRFGPSTMVLDSTGIVDTTFTLHPLQGNKYYYWRVRAWNSLGESEWSPYYRFQTEEVQVFVDDFDPPRRYELWQNFPNPFRLDRGQFQTTIRYQLAIAGETLVRIHIYNLIGQRIRTLVSSPRPAGVYQVHWDGRDKSGELVPSGVYLYRIVAGPFHRTRKMIVIR